MHNYQDVLHRLRLNQSIRQIHKDTKIHKTLIRKIKKTSEVKQWLDPSNPIPSLAEIDLAFNQIPTEKKHSHILDECHDQIKEWHEKGHSNVVIHALLKDRLDISLSTVRRYREKHFPGYIDPVMIRSIVPGEVAEVDFGQLGTVHDATKNRNRIAWIFSMRLRYSRKAYREVVFDQTQMTFYTAHIHAFEYFCGVPHKVTPDNLKAAVIEASMTDPLLNSSYRELAQHYGFLISPCDPYTPRHKGGVENDIKYVKKNFWPIFCENEKLRGRAIPSIQNIQNELDNWNSVIAERRTISGVGKTVGELFEEERFFLSNLSVERWDPIEWKKAKVGKDWRITFESAYYSVPYRLIGEEVMICASKDFVRVFFKYKEVAVHPRTREKWQYKRRAEHAPPQHEDVLNANRGSLLIRAELIGGAIQAVVEHFLNDQIQDFLKAARLLLNLEKKFGQIRLEAACKRALRFQTISYKSIHNILEQNLDLEPFEEEVFQKPQRVCQTFRFARPIEDFVL